MAVDLAIQVEALDLALAQGAMALVVAAAMAITIKKAILHQLPLNHL